MYKCEKCGKTAELAENCPDCNVPMVEVKDEPTAGGQQTTDQPVSNEQPQ